MKRNLILFVILAVLFGLSFWLLRDDKQSRNSNSFEMFAVKDTNSISRIFIANRAGGQILLERRGDKWMYTNKLTGKTYSPNPDNIALILQALADIRVRMKVNDEAVGKVVSELSTKGIKIEVYTGGSKPAKVYYIAGRAMNDTGNYAMLEGRNDPLIVFLPLFQGDMRPRYPTDDRSWRDLAVFRYDPKKIARLSMEYHDPKQHDLSFSIEGRKVKPISATTPALPDSDLNQIVLDKYMANYGSFIAEQFLTRAPERDSILAFSPLFCTLTVTQKDGTIDNYKFYPLKFRKIDGVNPITPRQAMQRYATLINDGEDVLLVQEPVFEKYKLAYPIFFGRGMPTSQ